MKDFGTKAQIVIGLFFLMIIIIISLIVVDNISLKRDIYYSMRNNKIDLVARANTAENKKMIEYVSLQVEDCLKMNIDNIRNK